MNSPSGIHSLDPWKINPLRTSNASLVCPSIRLKVGSESYDSTIDLVSLSPRKRVDIAPMKLVFSITCLRRFLKYSLNTWILDVCPESSSITWFDSPLMRKMSDS